MRKINKKQVIGIISLIILLSISCISFSADSNEFDSTINLATSTAKGLTVALIEPDSNHFKAADAINFRAVASYNKSLELSCDLYVDNNVIDSMDIDDGNELIVSSKFTFTKGAHSWHLKCSDSMNNTATSSSKGFTVDLQGPSINLNNNDPDLSFYDYIELRFTPTDDYSSTLNCDLFVNDAKNATVEAANNEEKKVKVSSLNNASYRWSVACRDKAGNEGASSEGSFYIDTKRNFSIIPNKETYHMGEKGVYYVTAPYGATAKVIITSPKSTTTIKDYNSPFPVMDDMGPFDYAGEYVLDGYITFNGAVKQTQTKVNVENNIHVSIYEINKTRVVKGTTLSLSATGSGGLGALAYVWNFVDGSPEASGTSVSHKFDNFGSFKVKVTAKDTQGNEASDYMNIIVEETYPVRIKVIDAESEAVIVGATVYLDGEEKSTDASGFVNYDMFKGDYSLIVKKDDYRTYLRSIDVVRNSTVRVALGRLTINETNKIVADAAVGEEDNKDESAVKDDSLADEIKSLIVTIDESISSISLDDEGAAALNLKDNLDKARGLLNMMNRDFMNLNINEKGLTKDEIDREKKAIGEKVQKMKETTMISLEVGETNEIIMLLSDSEVDKVSEEYLRSVDAQFTASQLKSLEERNRKIKSSLSAKRQYIAGTIEYLSGDQQPVTLVIDSIELKDRVPGSSLVLFVPKEIASSVGEMNIITDHEVINEDPLIGFSIDQEELIYYFGKQLAEEDVKKIIPALMASADDSRIDSGITGFAIMPDLGSIDNPLLVMEIIIIIILVIAFLFYQFDLTEKAKGLMPQDNEIRQVNALIKETRSQINRKEIDSAAESYKKLAKAYKDVPAAKKPKIEAKVKDVDCLMIFAKLDAEADKAMDHIKEGRHAKAKASYKIIKDIYKGLPKEYKAKACSKCEALFKKLSM